MSFLVFQNYDDIYIAIYVEDEGFKGQLLCEVYVKKSFVFLIENILLSDEENSNGQNTIYDHLSTVDNVIKENFTDLIFPVLNIVRTFSKIFKFFISLYYKIQVTWYQKKCFSVLF